VTQLRRLSPRSFRALSVVLNGRPLAVAPKAVLAAPPASVAEAGADLLVRAHAGAALAPVREIVARAAGADLLVLLVLLVVSRTQILLAASVYSVFPFILLKTT